MLNYLKKILQGGRKPGAGPQTYAVTFSVEAANTLDRARTLTLVLPLPQTTSYQVVQGKLLLNHAPYRYETDRRFGNSYILLETTLPKKARREFQYQIQVRVSPRSEKIDPAFTLEDYGRIRGTKEYNLYLVPNSYVSGEDPRIQAMAETVKGNSLEAITKDAYEFVLGKLTYGNPVTGLYTFQEALEKRTVDCGGFDTLLASLYRAKGIPSRIVSGFWAEGASGEASKKMHAWLEILLPNGRWFPIDPSIGYLKRQGRTSRYGEFSATGNDRIVTSVGEAIPVEAGNTTQTLAILQNPTIISDGGREPIQLNLNADIVCKPKTS